MQAIHIVRTFTVEIPDGSEQTKVSRPVTDVNGDIHMEEKEVAVPKFRKETKTVDLLIAGPGLVVQHQLQAQFNSCGFPEGSRLVDTKDKTRYLEIKSPE